MTYTLKNKDTNVLTFDVVAKEDTVFGTKEYNYTVENIHVENVAMLPKTIKQDDLQETLTHWIKKRKVPKNREFSEKLVWTYRHATTEALMDYVDVSLALSLNDTYWVVPHSTDNSYTWDKYNLYENSFDEAITAVAFDGLSLKVSAITSSPEYTTNGMLKKCWHKEEDKIYLYKASSRPYANGGKEAFSEYYMAQIAQTMGFNAIAYDLKMFHNTLVSSCELFTSQKEGYLPIYYCLNEEARKTQRLELLSEIAKIYTNNAFTDLMVFDAMIYNQDRHLGNFGMLIDNDTGKLLKPAPIFDNGLSMINFLTQDELKTMKETLSQKEGYFGYGFDEQMRIFIEERHIASLEKLLTFEFKKHSDFNLSDEWLEATQKHIQERAKMAIHMVEEKKKY